MSTVKNAFNPIYGDDVFLQSREEIWFNLVAWTMFGVGVSFLYRGVKAAIALQMPIWKGVLTILGMTVLGVGVGFVQGSVSSLLVASMFNSIPNKVGLDTAAGFGIGQAVILIYFHMGRGDFVHR